MLKDNTLGKYILDISNTLQEILVYIQQKLYTEQSKISGVSTVLKEGIEGVNSIEKSIKSIKNEIYNSELVDLTRTFKIVINELLKCIEDDDLIKARQVMENEIVQVYNSWTIKIDDEFLSNNIYKSNIDNLVNRYGEGFLSNFNKCLSDTKIKVDNLKDYYRIELKRNEKIDYIYEKYYSKENKNKIIDDINNNVGKVDDNTIFIVYGFGMGYYISQLFSIMGKNNYLLIVEPDINVFNKALKLNRFTKIFSAENIYLALGTNIHNFKSIINMVVNERNKQNRSFKIISNGQYDMVYSDFYKMFLNEIKHRIDSVHPNFFPLITENETFIGKSIFENRTREAYCSGYYNEVSEEFPVNLWPFYKTEILYGKRYDKPNINISVKDKCVLPILFLEPNCNLKLNINSREYSYKNILPNRYNYYPINDIGNVNIQCDKDIVIGKPVSLVQNKKHKTKLVLYIFIDGLAKFALNKETIKQSMPNTIKFFNKGAKFNNCYFNTEWTLPSVPTLFSGKYACNNKMYHPNSIPFIIGEDYPILSECFQDEEYFTFQVGGDWRKNPLYGYVKGFDRTIYKRAMDYKDVIFASLEQMRAFKNRDQFGWISFFDMHDLTAPIPDIANQIENSLEAHNYEENEGKSVYKEYNEVKSEMFLTQAQKLDFYLKIIYDYIEENYNDDETLVVLCTDHGQSYLGDDTHPLNDARAKIPLLIKGRGVPNIEVNEFVENVDVFPTILSLADIKFDEEQIDGRIPKDFGGDYERNYVYYESIFPEKTFKAIIKDKEHKFIFETEKNVLDDGRVKIGNFEVKLINLLNGQDESDKFKEKVDNYVEVVLTNIKNITILDK